MFQYLRILTELNLNYLIFSFAIKKVNKLFFLNIIEKTFFIGVVRTETSVDKTIYK